MANINTQPLRGVVALAVASALSWATPHAGATLTNDVPSQTCVGHLQITDGNPTVVSCDGELTLSGGRLVSDQALVIEGQTGLHLMDVRVTAPSLVLRSSGAITLNEGVGIDSASFTATATEGAANASLTVAPGAVIANQASLQARTQDAAALVPAVALQTDTRAGGTISLQPGVTVVAQDPAAPGAVVVAASDAASAAEATPAAVTDTTATTGDSGQGGGGAIDGLMLLVLAAGVCEAARRQASRR